MRRIPHPPECTTANVVPRCSPAGVDRARHCSHIRAHGRRLPIAKRLPEVHRACVRDDRVVLEKSERLVAVVTKQTAHLVGRMVMIDAELQAGPLADAAAPMLARQDRVVGVGGKSVDTSASFFMAVGILPIAAPLTLVEFLAIGGVECAVPRQ